MSGGLHCHTNDSFLVCAPKANSIFRVNWMTLRKLVPTTSQVQLLWPLLIPDKGPNLALTIWHYDFHRSWFICKDGVDNNICWNRLQLKMKCHHRMNICTTDSTHRIGVSLHEGHTHQCLTPHGH